jgi:hypothetical protein
LATAAYDMAPAVYATLDGAQFDDLPALLGGANLKSRSLFLGAADPEIEAVGPGLVEIDIAGAMDRFLGLLGDKPAAVLWSCDAGDAALYRHLRLLNEAMVPILRDNAPPRPQGEPRPPSDYREERVLFRHFDPRVLAQVLPVLDERQFARVLGPAALILLPRASGPPLRAPALETTAIAPQGPLRLSVGQMDAIADMRAEASRQVIAAYLRKVAPGETGAMDDVQLQRLVRQSEQSGRAMGLKSEQALGRWAYVMTRTNGRALEQPGLRGYITDGRSSPDEKMVWLLKSMAVMERRVAGSP